jgi:hypothetical protein
MRECILGATKALSTKPTQYLLGAMREENDPKDKPSDGHCNIAVGSE